MRPYDSPESHPAVATAVPVTAIAPAPGAPPSRLEPMTQTFIDSLAGSPPLTTLSPEAAHTCSPTCRRGRSPCCRRTIEDTTWPVGPTGTTKIRIVPPAGAQETLPLLMYFHGGGWVLGDTITHDRLVRELAEGVNATVVFVDYINSPNAQYPTQNEQAYASLVYAVEHARDLRVDASPTGVVGDSVGGQHGGSGHADGQGARRDRASASRSSCTQ